MNLRITNALLLIAVLAVPLGVMAESDPGDSPAERPKRARLFLVLRMAEELDLTDEKALEVNRLLEQAEPRREEVHNKRRELNDRIRELLDKPQRDDAELAKLVDQAIDLDRQQVQALQDSFNSLKKVLTVEQQAKLVLLRAKMYGEAHRPGGFFGRGAMDRWCWRGTEDEGGRRPPLFRRRAPDAPGSED
jgi:Spy/CpxP family protein refolding chaperone